jgi:ligand-binding sensor domain-containing protein
MKSILFLTSLLFGAFAFSQMGTGQWRLHVSPTETVDVAAGNGVVLAAYPDGIQEYDVKSGESTYWTEVNSLSDINLTALFFDPVSDAFWVGYANGNIDKIKKNRVLNIPAIKLASVQGDKRVNKFYAHSGFIYVSSGLGIVKINPVKNEVVESYYPTGSADPILEVAIFQDTLYALTANKLLKGSLQNPALADQSQWTTDSRVETPAATAKYQNLVLFKNNLYLSYLDNVYGKDSIFQLSNAGFQMVVGDVDMEITNLKVLNNKLHVIQYYGVLSYEEINLAPTVLYSYSFTQQKYLKSIAFVGGDMYIGDAVHGLVYYNSIANNRILKIDGPPKNKYFRLGGTTDKIAVAGGSIYVNGFTYSTAGAYVLDGENWKLFDPYNQTAWQGKSIWDISTVTINPKNPNQMAFGSYSDEPLALSTNGNQITQLFDTSNSILQVSSEGNGMTLISDLKYDEKGNLWILNGESSKPLKVISSDGSWHAFDLGNNLKGVKSGKVVVDYNNNKWIYFPYIGMVGFKDGGTIANPADDKVRFFNKSIGELPSNNVTALAVDFDNKIWIGTDMGFAILYNSNGVFDAAAGDSKVQRIKLEFENQVSFMLGYTHITDIEVDGGNRKWMGTSGAGVFLLSADGTEIIQHFTKENSKLISDNIVDMQFNHSTGELFIITDKGMVSYRADASYEDPEYSDVIVFPNPVRPEFNGWITIQGIKYNSDIRVTDIAGNLVYKTTSNGGTAVWNGKNTSGEKVKAGVYLIWTASNDGKGRKVGKVTVIN